MMPQYVTKEEAFSIVDAAKTEQQKLYILLLWYSGGRTSEIAELKVEDIGKNYVVIPNRKQKGEPDAHKQVFIPHVFADTLIEFAKKMGMTKRHYLFSDDGRFPWRVNRIHRIVTKASMKAGIMKVNRYSKIVPAWPHTFRHGAGTYLFKETHNILLVKQQLGHAQIRNTEIYTHLTEEDIVKAVEEAARDYEQQQ